MNLIHKSYNLHNYRIVSLFFSIFCCVIFVTNVACAAENVKILKNDEAELKKKGYNLIKKKNDAYIANDQTSTVTMHLYTKVGDEKKIVTKRFWKNYKGKDGIAFKTVFFTEFPPDAKGTGFLIQAFSEGNKPDDLMLYLPLEQRTMHISTRDQDSAFMGSDLTFGDMGQRKIEEDDHKLIKEDPCGSTVCFVVESVSKDGKSLYSKKVHWITKDDFITMKTEYFDRTGDLLKVQNNTWQEVTGYKVWKSSEVVNVQTRHRTVFEITDLKLNSQLSDRVFSERTLKNGKP